VSIHLLPVFSLAIGQEHRSHVHSSDCATYDQEINLKNGTKDEDEPSEDTSGQTEDVGLKIDEERIEESFIARDIKIIAEFSDLIKIEFVIESEICVERDIPSYKTKGLFYLCLLLAMEQSLLIDLEVAMKLLPELEL
jgi:hypothetical protein